MNATSAPTPEPGHPSVTRKHWSISPIWLVPVVAALIGISMLVRAWLSVGPEVTISFRTATGLEAGKTPVKYKDVTVGTVSAIALSDDGANVIATVSLVKSASRLARQDTRFWVVRPRIGVGGISGIDTLLSGAYIAVDAGSSGAPSQNFTGLETPPTVISGMPGKSFVLHATDLGSLDIGSPVYYRRIQVGRVSSYQLTQNGKGVDIQIFIDAPYDRYVTRGTRFWNAGGVDLSLGADGFKLKTQSMATIFAGGIAFADPPLSQAPTATEHMAYPLAPDQASAMAVPDGPAEYIQLRFDQSLRGLAVGAPVQFSGVNMGSVVSIDLDYDPVNRRFPSIVGIVLYPERLGRVLQKLPKFEGATEQEQAAHFLASLVDHGLRAQARTGNLLTGQLYIALDFVPHAPKVAYDMTARPLTLPTAPGSFDRLQEQLVDIVGKIDKIPLDSIGQHVDESMAELDKVLKQVNGQVLPEATQTLQQAKQALQQVHQTVGAAQGALAEDGPLQQNLQQTLQEVQRSARSLRVLTDMLGRHPESLLRGQVRDPSPVVANPPGPPVTPPLKQETPQ